MIFEKSSKTYKNEFMLPYYEQNDFIMTVVY